MKHIQAISSLAILAITTQPQAYAQQIDAATAAAIEAAQRAAGVQAQAENQEIPEELDLGTAMLRLSYDRSPAAVLKATRDMQKKDVMTDRDAFRMSVLFGDWAAVGKTLATLSPEQSSAAYSHLLQQLSEKAIPVGELLKQPDPSANNSSDEYYDPYESMRAEQQRNKELLGAPAPFLSEDFYGIIEAAPQSITEADLPALTKLAQVAVGEGGRASFVERLSKGWNGLGGTSPEGKALAARLLSSLGWIKDAKPFLPLDQAEWKTANAMDLVYSLEYFTTCGVENRDERHLAQAAELCAHLMKTGRFGNYTRPQFRLAMDRLVQLLPALNPADARKLINEHLSQQKNTLADLISIVAELGQNALKADQVAPRVSSLSTQHLILQAVAEKPDQMPPNTPVLIMNWLSEAEACYRAGGAVANEMSQEDRMMLMRYGYGSSRMKKATTLSTEQILSTAPPDAIVKRLNPGLAQRIELTMLKVNALRPQELDIEGLRAYLKKHPGLEREVCQDILSAWVSRRTKPAEDPRLKQMRAYGMYIPPQLANQLGQTGIPLTRLRQNQNIQHFKKFLADIRSLTPEPIDPGLVVQAFMTLHSGAEVYQLDDILGIFGPPEKMVRAELLELLGGMRQRLSQEWRDPKNQQAAATNRTEEETKDEVSRGYRTALELAKRGIQPDNSDWESFITRGQLFFDASEYEFERKVKLSEYTSLRDEAFASFRKAAEIYAAKLPETPRGQWTVDPHQAWFFVMLGASDLAQLTSNPARTDPGLKAIGDSLRALPGAAAAEHTSMFAKMLGEIFPQVPPNVRQRFLSAGLKIVGEDHPDAAAATASLDYYRELLDEIQLRISVDGPTRVGHSQPFGAFLSVETTSQLLRESGGFGKYLQNQSSQMQAMMGGQAGANPARNLRDELSKNIHAVLDETFEVVSITFHDSAIKTIPLARDGWVETPLAYLVLRAKTPAVDRIPSIQMDMDFVDRPGTVILPVMSQVLPIDAHDLQVDPRPCPEMSLSMTLDQREWKEQQVVVEIQAQSKGIIPKLEEFLDTEREGFDLEVTDGNLAVSQYVSDGKQRSPQADRNWQLTYKRKAGLRGPVRFTYPTLKSSLQPQSIEYKLYEEADLVTIDAAKAAQGIDLAGTTGSALRWLIPAALLAAALVFLRRWLQNRNKPTSLSHSKFLAPESPTPFNTIAFLHRLAADPSTSLASADRESLAADIASLEAAHFSGKSDDSGIDPAAITQKWLRFIS